MIELSLEAARKEAEGKAISFRSCWNCNGAHENLKESDYVIRCFACGNSYYKGIMLSDPRPERDLSEALNIKTFACFLDCDEKHPDLFGECILPRDDDGMGFALGLKKFKGRYVRITIEEIREKNGDPYHERSKW